MAAEPVCLPLIEEAVRTKVCRKCHEEFPATTEFFYPYKKNKDKLAYWCKGCSKQGVKDAMAKKPEKYREIRREGVRRWKERHPDALREMRRSEKHRQYMREYKRQYNTRLTEEQWARQREYMREYQRRRAAKLREDPRDRLWNNIEIHLSREYGIRPRSVEQTLGYSKDDLIKHIESLFDGPMTWDNYAAKEGFAWELDHVRPISEFNISSPDDPAFCECWGLQNLRPLWRLENRRRRGEEALTWAECWHPPEFENLPCRPRRQ